MPLGLPVNLLVVPKPLLLIGDVLRELLDPLLQFRAPDFEHEVGREDHLIDHKYGNSKKQVPSEPLGIKHTSQIMQETPQSLIILFVEED